MPAVQLNINASEHENSDSVTQFAGTAPEVVNAFIDDIGANHRRPGSEELSNVSNTTNVFTYWWQDGNMLISVDSNGSIFKTIKTQGTGRVTTNLTGDKLSGRFPPTFASNGTVVIIADGGRMVFTNGYTSTAFVADQDAPTSVSHVLFFDQYILANELNTSRFRFSEVTDRTDWRALSFFTAEASPDNIEAMIIEGREILAMGDRTGERWQNNGVDPFRAVRSLFIDSGISAPASFKKVGNTIFYLNDDRDVVKLQNRQPVIISKAIEKTLKSLSTVEDAIGDELNIDGRNFYVLSFPTDNITRVYDWALDKWYTWGFWNLLRNNYDRFPIAGITHAKGWGQWVGGSQRADGKILHISLDHTDDYDNDMRWKVVTGTDDYGSPNDKIGNHVKLRARRGIGTVGGNDPLIMTRFRNNKGPWSEEQRYSMGDPGEANTKIHIPSPGTFNNREWELTYTDEGEHVIASGTEHVEVLTQ